MTVSTVEVSVKEIDRVGVEIESNDELFTSLRGFLIFGRIIGLLPYKGVFSKSSSILKFSWISFPSIITCIIILSCIFNTTLELILTSSAPKRNALQVAESIRILLYNFWGTFVYIYFISKNKKFLEIFHTWKFTSVHFTKPDKTLKRDVVLIAGGVLLSGTLENLTIYLELVRRMIIAAGDTSTSPNKPTVYSIVQSQYMEWHKSWSNHFVYHPLIYAFIFIQHKFILFSWNCVDIWIAVLGRALYYKFKALCEVAEAKLVEPLKKKPRFSENPQPEEIPDVQSWTEVARDFVKLYKLLEAFEGFLSPLIFLSYMVNLYYISMHLIEGLTMELESHTIFEAINRPWSFAHLVLRVYLLSINCARVNVYAHQIKRLIHFCPSGCYNGEMSRLDKRVSGTRDIGLTGLECFTVTKPFLLSILGVVFTALIVLIQVIPQHGDGSGGGSQRKCCCP